MAANSNLIAAEFEAKKKAALEYIKQNMDKTFLIKDIQFATNISYNSARAVMKTLEREGKITGRIKGNFNLYQYRESVSDNLLKDFMRGAKMRGFRAA